MPTLTRHTRTGTPTRVEARRIARERMLRRRRRVFLLALLGASLVLVGIDMVRGGTDDPPGAARAASARHAAHRAPAVGGAARTHPAGSPTPSASPPAVSYPRNGSGTFRVAPGHSKVYGHSGTLLRFQVAVETDIRHLDPTAFAERVVKILGDPQGWTAGGRWRFQRVGPGTAHDFTLYLVTPGTRDAMCHDVPDGYTSCRWHDHVMINVSRWVHGVPYYSDLNAYRDYAVSHEVGHELGHGHELCPGKGRKAPTMQQQTLGLHGCVPNPWPYPHGTRYAGPQGDYSQAGIPTDPPDYYTH